MADHVQLNAYDFLVFGIYLVAMVSVGLWVGRRGHSTARGYFLGDRRIPCSSPLINTLLQRGVPSEQPHFNRFNGFTASSSNFPREINICMSRRFSLKLSKQVSRKRTCFMSPLAPVQLAPATRSSFSRSAFALCVVFLALVASPLMAQDPSPSSLPGKVYLFSYFTRNGEDGLHLAWSTNAYNWKALNGGRSLLQPTVGESKLMRDPNLLTAPDGTFHLVWTTAWKGKTIGHAQSKDLIHWSEEQAVPVMGQEPAADNCWAPEAFYDRNAGRYLIFWATTMKSTNATPDKDGNHRLYYTTTRDFQTFTPTKLFFDPGYSVIDGTLLERGGRFYLVFKDERVGPPAKKNLLMAEAANPEGPWKKISAPFTKSWVEGPTCLKLGDEVIVYFDCYLDHHYGALKSKDLVHWDDVTDRLSMPTGIRHGTAIEVPAKVLQPLLDL
jgi:hypothetical protein